MVAVETATIFGDSLPQGESLANVGCLILGWVVGVEPVSLQTLKVLIWHGWHPKDCTEQIGTINGR